MKLEFPGTVLYMEDGGPKRCGRCIHYIADGSRCILMRPVDTVSGPDGVCALYVNGTTHRNTKPVPGDFINLNLAASNYGADRDVGGYSCGNCRYGGEQRCAHPDLAAPKIDNVGGCCNIWDYPAQWPKRPPIRVLPRTVRA